MPKTKRVQVMMEPEEFSQLEQIARARGSSVAELIREAARDQVLAPAGLPNRAAAARRFLGGEPIRLPQWKTLKKQIESRYGEDLP